MTTTAFMVLELTWGSLDRKQQSLFIKGTPQQWLPCRNPYLSRATIRPRGRLKVEQIVKRYLAHIDSNNEWRLEQIPIQRKSKLEISIARLRLLSCFVGFFGKLILELAGWFDKASSLRGGEWMKWHISHCLWCTAIFFWLDSNHVSE